MCSPQASLPQQTPEIFRKTLLTRPEAAASPMYPYSKMSFPFQRKLKTKILHSQLLSNRGVRWSSGKGIQLPASPCCIHWASSCLEHHCYCCLRLICCRQPFLDLWILPMLPQTFASNVSQCNTGEIILTSCSLLLQDSESFSSFPSIRAWKNWQL